MTMLGEKQRGRGECLWLVAELVVALMVGVAFVASCIHVKINPMGRVGQVSILATVEWRLACFALPLIVGLVLAARVRGGAYFQPALRVVCAATAGLASATIAGGIVIVLHGTHYGLGGRIGDSSVLAAWADKLLQGKDVPALYPPLQIHLIAWLSSLLGVSTSYAIKPFQLLGLILVGPLAYTSWRLLLRPSWALGIGVLAALPLVDWYRPYPFLSLVVFVPLALRFLQILRGAADRTTIELVRPAVGIGLALGVFCLLYSGWFMWSAPGVLVTAAIVFPWRTGRRNGAIFCAVAAAVFGVVIARYFIGVLGTLPVKDGFMYFDSRVEPAYIAMWRGDLPGIFEKLGLWPPVGELAGVGVFSLLLVVGIAGAIALGRSRTVVIGMTTMLGGVWLLRFWNAHRMWETKLVQLYPRTTAELLYGALILCGFTVLFLAERARKSAPEDSPLRTPSGPIATSCGMLMLIAFAASPTVDRIMPSPDVRDLGNLSWRALLTPAENARNEFANGTIEASTSVEAEGWSTSNLEDDNDRTGYTSEISPTADHEEWIEFQLPKIQPWSRLVLRAWQDGFPVDFTIEEWSGTAWVVRKTYRNYTPTYGPEIFWMKGEELATRIRIHATKLSPVAKKGSLPEGYALRFAGIAAYR